MLIKIKRFIDQDQAGAPFLKKLNGLHRKFAAMSLQLEGEDCEAVNIIAPAVITAFLFFLFLLACLK
jgi:hypothetical protein